VAWAGTVLLLAFIVICLHVGTTWPWMRVVHEDGRRTLIDTILYFDHATRELPLDIILGICIGGCVFLAFPQEEPQDARRGSIRRLVVVASITLLIVAVILVGTAAKGGTTLVFAELLQNHTRVGVPPEFGSHWRYHLLERLAMMLSSAGFAGMLLVFGNGRHVQHSRLGLAIVAGSLGVYLAVTFIFSGGRLALMQPFRDPRYLGHQAREVLTHALVTVPMAWGVCILMLKMKTSVSAKPLSGAVPTSATIVGAMIAGAAGVLLAIYVCLAAWMSGAVSRGQTTDPVTLIFPHFFEHSFTYLVVVMIAALTYETASISWRSKSPYH
jgi:hypothetical protein